MSGGLGHIIRIIIDLGARVEDLVKMPKTWSLCVSLFTGNKEARNEKTRNSKRESLIIQQGDRAQGIHIRNDKET